MMLVHSVACLFVLLFEPYFALVAGVQRGGGGGGREMGVSASVIQ